MALNDDDMWNGRATAAHLIEDHTPPPAAGHHPLRLVTIALGIACVALDPLLLRTDEFLALFLAGALVGGVHSALLWTATRSHPRFSAQVLARIAGSAAVGSVVAVAGGCLYPSIGVGAAALCLAAILSLPYLIRRLAPRTRRVAGTPARQPARLALPTPPLARRSTLEITAAWTASHELLRRTPSAHERAVIAGLRQAYLDELERRDGEGVARWLASGRALDSDVAGYLAARDRDEPEPS
jgi:hypothetical protein